MAACDREAATVVVAEAIATVAGRAGASTGALAAGKPQGGGDSAIGSTTSIGRANGDETPETGTPPARSLSPSSEPSDGGASLSPLPPCPCRQSASGDAAEATVANPTSAARAGAQAELEAFGGGGDVDDASGGSTQQSGEGGLGPPCSQAAAFSLFQSPCTPGSPTISLSDRRIVQVLAAPEHVHQRLLHTAHRVEEILAERNVNPLCFQTELYGSLSLDMMDQPQPRNWTQDWVPYYVNARSDVDFVVELRHKIPPAAVAQRLLKRGSWQMVGQVQVHKFGSTQFTLLGSFGEESDAEKKCNAETDASPKQVYLDITCIERSAHFSRFKQRQQAFREAFTFGRSSLEARWGAQGALAFDAYLHLLKAFAAKVPGNTLAGFQATCIGLFTLQMGYFRLKPTHSIALSLFEGFLLFCYHFYGEAVRPSPCWQIMSYRQCAIDLTGGGRWLPRLCSNWRSELYFMKAEETMQTRPHERMNVTHSLDPVRVSAEAMKLLQRAFSSSVAEVLPGVPSQPSNDPLR